MFIYNMTTASDYSCATRFPALLPHSFILFDAHLLG